MGKKQLKKIKNRKKYGDGSNNAENNVFFRPKTGNYLEE